MHSVLPPRPPCASMTWSLKNKGNFTFSLKLFISTQRDPKLLSCFINVSEDNVETITCEQQKGKKDADTHTTKKYNVVYYVIFKMEKKRCITAEKHRNMNK
jgi:hypothetical protein